MDPNQTTPRSAAHHRERDARILLSPQHRRLPNPIQQPAFPRPAFSPNVSDPFIASGKYFFL